MPPVTVRCSRCGVVFDETAWRALVLVERIASERVRALVTTWQSDVSIEVRRCRVCGDRIARKHRLSPPSIARAS